MRDQELHDIAFHLIDKTFVECSDKAEIPTVLMNWKQFMDALLPNVIAGLRIALLAEKETIIEIDEEGNVHGDIRGLKP